MNLIIFCGLQASGKTTYREVTFDSTVVVVSKDLMGRSRKNKGAYQEQLIRMGFEWGNSIVVDNTNPAVEDRAPLIALGREYGAQVIGYHFKSTWEQSLERNSRRIGRAQVPYVALASTSKRFVAPNLSEGFDELYTVTWGLGGTFVKDRIL